MLELALADPASKLESTRRVAGHKRWLLQQSLLAEEACQPECLDRCGTHAVEFGFA